MEEEMNGHSTGDVHASSAVPAASSNRPRNREAIDPPGTRRRHRAVPPLEKVTVEVNWLTGPQAEEDLAHRQWLVIQEVLQWIVDHPQRESETGQPSGELA